MADHKHNFFDIRIVFAVLIIVAGAALLLENMGIIYDVNIFEWWPLILIGLGLGQIINSKKSAPSIGGIILLVVGVIFLGNSLDIFCLNWGDIWPVFLILTGLLILKNHAWKTAPYVQDKDFLNLSMILGGGDQVIESKNLKGGKITAIMGGAQIDLSNSEMEGNEIVIDIFACMGGVDLRVPRHWQVNMQGMPFLGSMENKTRSSYNQNEGLEVPQSAKVCTIKGMAFLGGVEVKN
jgi:predicted membrane protein